MHFCIALTDGTRLHVENGAGPLDGFDGTDSDPRDGATALWAAIENHDPIYVDGWTGPSWQDRESARRSRVWYPNIAHVLAVTEIA